MRRYPPILIVVAAALLTAGAGLGLYRTYKPQPVALSKEAAAPEKEEALHARGPVNAPVTIEEFGDFQCPPCGALSEPLNQLQHQYDKKVRLVFREFPLAIHQNAMAAALAAEAAGLQGRFWEMHDLLYREQANWSKAATPRELFLGYARIVGVDVRRFEKDMDSETVKERVTADQTRAQEFGVKVTPSIFVNAKSLHGPSLNPTGLRGAVDAALAEMPAH